VKGSSSKSVLPPEDTSPDAPWKDGRERSDRWKETLREGFLPRVSSAPLKLPGGCASKGAFLFMQDIGETRN